MATQLSAQNVESLVSVFRRNMSFAHLIKTRRVSLGLTQQQLAERLGVGQGTISAWEGDRRLFPRLSRGKLTKLANMLGLPEAALLQAVAVRRGFASEEHEFDWGVQKLIQFQEEFFVANKQEVDLWFFAPDKLPISEANDEHFKLFCEMWRSHLSSGINYNILWILDLLSNPIRLLDHALAFSQIMQGVETGTSGRISNWAFQVRADEASAGRLAFQMAMEAEVDQRVVFYPPKILRPELARQVLPYCRASWGTTVLYLPRQTNYSQVSLQGLPVLITEHRVCPLRPKLQLDVDVTRWVFADHQITLEVSLLMKQLKREFDA